MKVLQVTPQMRAEALWRDYQRRPRMFRLTPGHLRYIALLDQHRLNGHDSGQNGAHGTDGDG